MSNTSVQQFLVHELISRFSHMLSPRVWAIIADHCDYSYLILSRHMTYLLDCCQDPLVIYPDLSHMLVLAYEHPTLILFEECKLPYEHPTRILYEECMQPVSVDLNTLKRITLDVNEHLILSTIKERNNHIIVPMSNLSMFIYSEDKDGFTGIYFFRSKRSLTLNSVIEFDCEDPLFYYDRRNQQLIIFDLFMNLYVIQAPNELTIHHQIVGNIKSLLGCERIHFFHRYNDKIMMLGHDYKRITFFELVKNKDQTLGLKFYHTVESEKDFRTHNDTPLEINNSLWVFTKDQKIVEIKKKKSCVLEAQSTAEFCIPSIMIHDPFKRGCASECTRFCRKLLRGQFPVRQVIPIQMESFNIDTLNRLLFTNHPINRKRKRS
jgi:hypothetical protein